jgi:hypothetical protein
VSKVRSRSWVQWLGDLGLVAVGLVIVILFSSYGRPIWIDEFLHFALGGMDLGQVVTAIRKTTTEVNHGQTGVYMFVDYLLLKAFGASSLALRLPSLIATAMLLFSAATFIRLKGLSYGFQYLMLVVLAGQTALMYYGGEARPYMFLAATTVATLTYYNYPLVRRRNWLALVFGIFGVCVGVLMHPYYPLMLAVILPLSFWALLRDRQVDGTVRGFVRFANVPLLAVAAVLYLVVGWLTWMPVSHFFGLNPYEFMGSLSNAVVVGLRDHFQNVRDIATWLPLLVVLSVAALTWVRFRGAGRLAPPLALIMLALLSSAAVSYASYYRTYWIMNRQWVAGVALASVAMVWLYGEMHQMARQENSFVLDIPVALFAGLGLITALSVGQNQVSVLRGYQEASAVFAADNRSISELADFIASESDWVYVGNVNAARGGPVWPMFTDWYNRQAGMRPAGT